MSLDAHVDELRKKHRSLEATIEEQERYPASDYLDISKLKRKKLKIKDELERIAS